MKERALALDAASKRHKDVNGFLHVDASNISKETVNPYYGREIPGWEGLGLEPERIYMGYRPGEELKKAGADHKPPADPAAAPRRERRSPGKRHADREHGQRRAV